MSLQKNHSSISAQKGMSGQETCSNKSNRGTSPIICIDCGTNTTPLWRRTPNGDVICNACGLYQKSHATTCSNWSKRDFHKRIVTVSLGDEERENIRSGENSEQSTNSVSTDRTTYSAGSRGSLVCSNCRTDTTPLWRRDESGTTICNACGLYFKLHGVHRPVSMKRSIIKRRKRNFHSRSPSTRNCLRTSGVSEENRELRQICCHHDHDFCFGSKSETSTHNLHDYCSKKPISDNECVTKHHQHDYCYGGSCKGHRSHLRLSTHSPDSRFSTGQISEEGSLALSHICKSSSPSPNLQSSDSSSPNSPKSSDVYTPLVYGTSRPTLPPIQALPLNSQDYPTVSACSVSKSVFTQSELPSHSSQNQFTREDLQVHRQELKREISHLSMLLSRTSSMLTGLDHLIELPISNSPLPTSQTHHNTPLKFIYPHVMVPTWSKHD